MKMTVTEITEKQIWIDHLRAVATIAVVFLHVSAPLIYKFGVIPMSWWWIANIFNSTVRCSVPLFFMVSGALLLPKEQELSVFLKKRFLRIVYPFLFWGMIHILMNLLLKIRSHEVRTLDDVLVSTATKISSGVAYHYWYIFVIIGIYLFVPIIGRWARSSSRKELQYFLILWISFTILSLTPVAGFRYFSQLTYFFSGSMGFLILGYYLVRFSVVISNRWYFLLILILLIMSALTVTIFGSYYLSSVSGKSVQSLYSYFSPNIIIVTISVFLLFQNFNIQQIQISKALSWVSRYSYGIFLSHVLVLTLLSFLKIDAMFIHPLIGIITTAVLCVTVSGFMVFIINKLPFGKYISG